MPRESSVTAVTAWLARLPFRLWGQRSFTTPQKVLILKPCCLSQVLLTTPLLAVLSTAYPEAQFDWAVSQWARPAIAGNPRLAELIPSGKLGLGRISHPEMRRFIGRIRAQNYDTCIIPSRSSWLAYAAWRAGIPQRIGLDVDGRGFSHTLPVRPSPGVQHEAELYLSIAQALRIDPQLVTRVARAEFFPADRDRTAITARLVEEVDWLGDKPLVVMHPGGGRNPIWQLPQRRWPVERFARLGNHLVRQADARLVLVGDAEDAALTTAVAGLMAFPVVNLAGRMSLGEIGALAELADLYVGNDAGPTHVAAAVGCPTLAIFGPSDPAVSAPYVPQGRVITLHRETAVPFSWANGVSVEEAIAAATALLAPSPQLIS